MASPLRYSTDHLAQTHQKKVLRACQLVVVSLGTYLFGSFGPVDTWRAPSLLNLDPNDRSRNQADDQLHQPKTWHTMRDVMPHEHSNQNCQSLHVQQHTEGRGGRIRISDRMWEMCQKLVRLGYRRVRKKFFVVC